MKVNKRSILFCLVPTTLNITFIILLQSKYKWFSIHNRQLIHFYDFDIGTLNVHCVTHIFFTSVATKIENGPKTNTKILRFLKIDRRRIRRIFVNSKILRRSSKIANSSNIFEDTKIFKGKWKIFVVKNFLSGSNLDKFSQQ